MRSLGRGFALSESPFPLHAYILGARGIFLWSKFVKRVNCENAGYAFEADVVKQIFHKRPLLRQSRKCRMKLKFRLSFLTAAVTKAIEEEPSQEQMTNHVNGKVPQGMENHDSIISSYKELIREQVTVIVKSMENNVYLIESFWYFRHLDNRQTILSLILITIVRSFTNSLSLTSLYFSLKTSFVYSNLFSLAKTVTD